MGGREFSSTPEPRTQSRLTLAIPDWSETKATGMVAYLHHDAQVLDVVLLSLDQLLQHEPEQTQTAAELGQQQRSLRGRRGRRRPCGRGQPTSYSHPPPHGFGSPLHLGVPGLHWGALLRRGQRGEAGVRSWFQGLGVKCGGQRSGAGSTQTAPTSENIKQELQETGSGTAL